MISKKGKFCVLLKTIKYVLGDGMGGEIFVWAISLLSLGEKASFGYCVWHHDSEGGGGSLSTHFGGHSGLFSDSQPLPDIGRPSKLFVQNLIFLEVRVQKVHSNGTFPFRMVTMTDTYHRNANWHNPPDGRKMTINLCWGWGSLLC